MCRPGLACMDWSDTLRRVYNVGFFMEWLILQFQICRICFANQTLLTFRRVRITCILELLMDTGQSVDYSMTLKTFDLLMFLGQNNHKQKLEIVNVNFSVCEKKTLSLIG